MYKAKLDDRESVSSRDTAEAMHSALAQIVGISILEVGVVLHRFALYDGRCHVSHLNSSSSVLIGLTLAVDPDFKILFVVLIFHRE